LGYWEGYGYSDTADITEDSVPEFPTATAMLVSLFLVGIFALVLKKKTKMQQTKGSPFLLCCI
jgi:hypothetical protein